MMDFKARPCPVIESIIASRDAFVHLQHQVMLKMNQQETEEENMSETHKPDFAASLIRIHLVITRALGVTIEHSQPSRGRVFRMRRPS
jgi:hypothetical protein